MRLAGKRVIMTGGASGIGRAICQIFAKEGATVWLGDLDKVGGETSVELIQSNGQIAHFYHLDVSKEDQVQAFVAKAAQAMGGIDILVNNAAAFVFGKVEDVSRAEWEKVMAVNVYGPASMAAQTLPYLKQSPKAAIVNIASVSSLCAAPAFVPYNSSKGALLQLTRCLAMDLAPDNIRVNCVCPGAILTPATDKHIEFEGADREEFLKAAANSNLLKRHGQPEEIAYAALFLASDEASFITGTHLVVDGGLLT